MSRRFKTVLAATVLTASTAAADTWVVDKQHSNVNFQIRHLVSKVSGRFTDFQGTIEADSAKPEASSVEFTIKAASIDTSVEARDKDLRSANFFEVEKYPEISFKSTKFVPKGKDQFDVTGKLTIRGVTKDVTLPVSYLGMVKDPWGNEKTGFELGLTLNRKDYGIVWNKALDSGGVLLGDEVTLNITLEAAKKKEATTK